MEETYGPGDELLIVNADEEVIVTVERKFRLGDDGKEQILVRRGEDYFKIEPEQIVRIVSVDSEIQQQGFEVLDPCVICGPMEGITVSDDDGNPVEVGFLQAPSGGVFAIDGPYLEQDAGPIRNPYSGREIVIEAKSEWALGIFTEDHGWVEV